HRPRARVAAVAVRARRESVAPRGAARRSADRLPDAARRPGGPRDRDAHARWVRRRLPRRARRAVAAARVESAPMSKTTTGLIAVILAVAGFALGRWTAAHPADASAPAGEDAARRAIAELTHAPPSVENVAQLAQLMTRLGPEAVPAIAPAILNPG